MDLHTKGFFFLCPRCIRHGFITDQNGDGDFNYCLKPRYPLVSLSGVILRKENSINRKWQGGTRCSFHFEQENYTTFFGGGYKFIKQAYSPIFPKFDVGLHFGSVWMPYKINELMMSGPDILTNLSYFQQ